jgi:hypothetical protein
VQVPARGIEAIEDRVRVPEEDPPRLGGRDAARGALEELGPGGRLERRDLA